MAIRRRSKDKGRIEIAYYSQEELERIVELLSLSDKIKGQNTYE